MDFWKTMPLFTGIGAIIGGLVGGFLTDKFGSFKIQTLSLFACIPVYLFLPELTSFESLCFGIALLSSITEMYDFEHSIDEDRYIAIGKVGELLFVVFTERKEKIRIISARIASEEEQKIYYDQNLYY